MAHTFIIAGQYAEKLYSDIPFYEYVKSKLIGGRTKGRIKKITEHAISIEYETKSN